MEISNYSKCNCGAITININGSDYSVLTKHLKKFIDIDLRKHKSKMLSKTYCCDYCVNHYGLDLCGCGSGKLFGSCQNNLKECNFPMQILNEYSRIKGGDIF